MLLRWANSLLEEALYKGRGTFPDQDDNPVYGIYASDGMDTTEATDTNEVYGGGEE